MIKILNQIISLYIVYTSIYFMVYLVMCSSFELRISKGKALLLAFLCSNFLTLTSTFSLIYIGNGTITETYGVLMMNKAVLILGEFIMIAFLIKTFRMQWYRIYWITYIIYMVLSVSTQLFYIEKFNLYSMKYIYVVPVTLKNSPFYLFAIAMNILCSLIVIFIIRKATKYWKPIPISKWSWIILYTGFAFVLLTVNKHYSPSIENARWQGLDNFDRVTAYFFVIVILVLISINHSEKKILKIENKLLKEQNELQYANYLSMQQQEIKIHKLYHDIGNHLKTIQILVSNGENQQAKDYAEGLLKEYNNIHKNYYCNNNIINAVLSQKMKICGQSKIEHDIDVHIPDQLPIRDIDLMSVYANLLDNAIEGCRRNLECNNYIKVKTSVIGNYFTVKIINSKSKIEENSENSKYFPTRKKNKSMHGYGMKILEEIVQRYDGQREFIDLGEEFSAMILLKIQ